MQNISNETECIKLIGNTSELTIDSHFGALPLSWKVQGQEILFTPENYRAIKGKRMCGIPLMYPFANRISPDKLTISERECMPIQAVSELLRDGNQIIMHGLLLWKDDWKVQSLSTTSVTYTLDWNQAFWGYPYLPIHHVLNMTFSLLENTLDIGVEIINCDTVKLPLSFGFHPYFLIDRADDNVSEISIPSNTFNQTNEKLFPTGVKADAAALLRPDGSCNLGTVALDTCFVDLITNENQQVITTLKTPKYDLQISMDKVYKNLIVYLPQDTVKPYICIEPMLAATNAWHSHIDLIFLDAKDTFNASFKMQVTIK